ncbi:EamA family transporter [Cuneatibacter sp. NSJ-177]|uniref:EamA family transporter n=1 Tax=Cuneatibacter sp. NSJ-177 TaxID=2931401 RepID=UPI001FD40AC3|nr:EamA family transporter [Cuneatibacter sp. NSJ-177]MCJ7835699.1 EamA family transporter [Cuneatibacter sp. NSJ-177]
MWLLFAAGSAVFAGLTAILAKLGMEKVNSHLGTAVRTCVVAVFAWLLVLISGAFREISEISGKTLLFLILSGLATGGSWICYFRALQLGNVNQVTPIDKSSTVLTMVLAFFLLGEPLGIWKLFCMILMLAGTYLMIEKKAADPEKKEENGWRWLIYAIASAVFAALTAILGKIGIQGIDSNLGTAIRTLVVLALAWGIVFSLGLQKGISSLTRKNWVFLILSGLATGLSWLCYYRALQEGEASIVVPIDKLSILITVAFSALILKEKLSGKAAVGLVLLTAGTLLLLR